jgi:hypothetical protein
MPIESALFQLYPVLHGGDNFPGPMPWIDLSAPVRESAQNHHIMLALATLVLIIKDEFKTIAQGRHEHGE